MTSRVRIKLCGLTTEDAVRVAATAGVDAAGFVFAASPRQVTVEWARELAAGLPGDVLRVAVFRHPEPEEVARVLDGFDCDVVQAEPDDRVEALLGDRVAFLPVFHDSDDVVLRAVGYRRERGLETPLLLEAAGRGGRGRAPSHDRAAELAREVPLILAGGLDAGNVAGAMRRVRPLGVDVSSGIESEPGVKDRTKIAAFVEAVREAERQHCDGETG